MGEDHFEPVDHLCMGKALFASRIQKFGFPELLVQFNQTFKAFIMGLTHDDHVTLSISGDENGLSF